MDYINVSALTTQFPEIDDLQDDEMIKRNHPQCPAGKDTKERLFVSRKGDRLVAYCHNCQLKGSKRLTAVSHIRRGGQNLLLNETIHLPGDLMIGRDAVPAHRVWLNQYGITNAMEHEYSIGWSGKYGRTILPVNNIDGNLVAYQRRAVEKHDLGPKYLTTRLKWIRHPVFWSNSYAMPSTTLVLVEDILSAIKVGYSARSVALLGTFLHQDLVEEIAGAGYEHVIIWLDDDNDQVRKAQRGMRKMLSPYVDVTVLQHNDLGIRPDDKADPKMFTTSEIAKILTLALEN